ncbi:aldehyde dehydrogenase [Caulobacter sp. Root655]|uniref:cytochrome c n=1 Tax=Caulobacter sp. Root655 TaxID=1736578 RepID=UPI0006F8DC3D|nr:cytochrome c [Caulobacter sp. Root655]KRA66525.1 aldehyde dehydrogenase [Caulobacter sp. Root655]
MLKRLLVGLLAAVVVAMVGFAAFAWRPSIGKITPPAASGFSPALVARGEVLAGAGYCSTCHTAKGGQPFAGGYPMQTGFGTIYSTNITPDAKTGIGTWSEAAFRRAMHQGVARDGSHLLPAFPYDHFTKLTDADVSALYAYMMTRPAVVAPDRRNGIAFPLNIRALQAGWKLLYFRPGRFEPDAARSAEWNRGAYLAQGVSHCGACHTPRGALGAEKRDKAFAGAAIDNWIAPALTAANPSPAPWDRAELVAYLRTGVSHYHGVAAGPMAPVVHDGLAKLPDADIRALAVYFADTDGAAGRAASLAPALQRAAAADRLNVGPQTDPSARLYTAACASCHYNGAGQPAPLRPDLALNSAVNLDDPTNLVRVVLHGVGAREGAPGVVMPAFDRLSDADIARLATYLRATRTDKPAWPNLEKKVAAIRAQGK